MYGEQDLISQVGVIVEGPSPNGHRRPSGHVQIFMGKETAG